MELENVGVKDTAEAVIGADDRISLSEGQERIELVFDQIHQVSALKLTVFETDRDRLQRWYVTIPSLNQWWPTIKKPSLPMVG